MKFWEALREMERGAVCAPVDECQLYAIRGGKFGLAAEIGVVPTYLDVDQLSGKDWRIVTPAPSETQPLVNFHSTTLTADAEGVQRGPIDVYAVGGRGFSSTALQKRVEALEERADDARSWLKSHGASNVDRDARLNALEAKLAALEGPKDDDRWKVVPCTPDGHPIAAPVAWPVGSLQWAELEAKKLGRPAVRRRTWGGGWIQIAHADELKISNSGRHALDWEPCE